MYLLYADESGDASEDYFVVGGLAVEEHDVFYLSRLVDRTLTNFLPRELAERELHTHDLRAGKGIWRSVPRETRSQVTTAIGRTMLRKPRTEGRPPVLFAVAMHRTSFPTVDPIERTYEEFFARANGFLGRLSSQGDRHRSVAILDKSRLETRLQSLMTAWQRTGSTTGASVGPLRSFAEVPMFVDSAATRLVQLADFVAHWVFRAYQRSDPSVLNQLLPAFDADGGQYSAWPILSAAITRARARPAQAVDRSRGSRGALHPGALR